MRPASDIYLKATIAAIKANYASYLSANGATLPRVEVFNVTEERTEDKADGLRRITAVVEAVAGDAGTAKTMIGNMCELLCGRNKITATGVSDVFTEMMSVISMTETDNEDRMLYRETMNLETTLNI